MTCADFLITLMGISLDLLLSNSLMMSNNSEVKQSSRNIEFLLNTAITGSQKGDLRKSYKTIELL